MGFDVGNKKIEFDVDSMEQMRSLMIALENNPGMADDLTGGNVERGIQEARREKIESIRETVRPFFLKCLEVGTMARENNPRASGVILEIKRMALTIPNEVRGQLKGWGRVAREEMGEVLVSIDAISQYNSPWDFLTAQRGIMAYLQDCSALSINLDFEEPEMPLDNNMLKENHSQTEEDSREGFVRFFSKFFGNITAPFGNT